ncbi:MAG: hypothetical protein Q9227_002372 [Pyrenula ochraceoflavens]
MHPLPPPPGKHGRAQEPQTSSGRPPTIPESSAAEPQSMNASSQQQTGEGRKKKRHRAGKKKRNRRQSFAAPSEDSTVPEMPEIAVPHAPSNTVASRQSPAPHKSLYRLGSNGANLSSTSLDSEALYDHRDQPSIPPRRDSRALGPNFFNSQRNGSPRNVHGTRSLQSHQSSSMYQVTAPSDPNSEDEGQNANDKTPLLGTSPRNRRPSDTSRFYGLFSNSQSRLRRRQSSASSKSSKRRKKGFLNRENSYQNQHDDYDVNNPPSVPGSPTLDTFNDVMVGDVPAPSSPEYRRDPNDSVIDVDGQGPSAVTSSPPSPRLEHGEFRRRRALTLPVEDDVCFPTEGISEIGEEDFLAQGQQEEYVGAPRRRRRRQWPDLDLLEAWRREEKEQRSEGIPSKKISEPVLVGGRLRPQKSAWHRVEEDAPYRFTYFNETFPSTIHAQTISELVQPGGSFRELFIPDPPELDESSSDEEDEESSAPRTATNQPSSPTSQSVRGSRQASLVGEVRAESRETSGQATPSKEPLHIQKPKKYGPKPTFWLDVLCPTELEMRTISKAFGIHALTNEDILMQEAREKVELFRNYYFINYRTFEQDQNSENFLEPVNMYVVVFREGVLSFHFSQSPHPANVRRRIRQLKDYLLLTSDWISYAIIDDITDVFGPLIQSIEEEVDDIDDTILKLHSDTDEMKGPSSSSGASINEKRSDSDGPQEVAVSGSDMLRRVGEGRKKVMGLYRLLGNKADVIKGFAKRCNEHWEVAPKTEIGLYLGDIQDHILTMTSNLTHYETLLSRAHSNYLAQINIRMNERQEKTADVLGKLTVLGTIVLPMNIICGMWGMNVQVPGQEVDNLYWFWSITAGLVVFAVVCFYVAKRVYGIV